MLSSIRKFSSSIYAKILLGIVIIPFVFWGMGNSFSGGNKNVIVTIDKEKFSTEEFANYVSSYQNANVKISSEKIDELLSIFIGDKLIEKEYERYKIKLSNISLSKLIKIQNEFKEGNEFSRVQYEKFLITNNLNAVAFEKIFADKEKKQQLLNFIGGGIEPSKHIVTNLYNKINQRRKIQLINLKHLYEKEISFNEDVIKKYYEENKDKYIDIYKSVKILEINPENLIGTDEFSDLFFEKLDAIEDAIIQGKKLDSIIMEYNLKKANIYKINKFAKDLNNKKIKTFTEKLVKNIFSLSNDESTSFVEESDRFYIIEILDTENIKKDLDNENVLKDIKNNLRNKKEKKLIAEILAKINQKTFVKEDFDSFSKDNNVSIQEITLENLNDTKILKKEIVAQIYAFPEKKVVLAYNLEFTENFLVYIDKVINVSMDVNSDEYEKYLKLSKNSIANGLFNTYDKYIKEKYEIDINYKALTVLKNYFN